MQKSYALFDFDGTLLKGDSIVRFCLYARSRGLCTGLALWRGAWMAARYYCHTASAEQSKQAALSFLAGHSKAELDALAADFCRQKLLPALYPQGVAALRKRRAEGAELLLVTASPAFYLEPLKESLGLTQIIGTRMDVDARGFYTGLICGENCRGVQKPLRLAEYLAATGDRLDYASSYAYGDSGSDEPLLSLCAHKIAVNPKRKLLRKLRGADGVAVARWGDGLHAPR
ncbi:MAG: HAD family hydrolase [Clostridia bacterium]